MHALDIINPGPDSRLEFVDMETPVPAPDELLVKVHATALNRADLMQRRGHYPPPPGASPILGLEMAGIVEATGSRCEGWSVGDRVMGLLSGGGYATHAVIHGEMAMPLPEDFTFEQGAAVPEVFLTAFQSLFLLGELRRGESVLIHAGASGVGTAAIQLAKAAGATVYITASAGKHPLCSRLGASAVIDYREEQFVERIAALTEEQGVDVIVDVVGAPYFLDNVDALGLDGRLVILAMMGGSKVNELDLRSLFRKRIHVKTSTLRNRGLEYKIALTKAFSSRMLTLFESGDVVPVIDSEFDWRDAEEAHARMAANQNAGKIVLRVN